MRAKSFSHWRVAPCAPRAGASAVHAKELQHRRPPPTPTSPTPDDAHHHRRRAPPPTTRTAPDDASPLLEPGHAWREDRCDYPSHVTASAGAGLGERLRNRPARAAAKNIATQRSPRGPSTPADTEGTCPAHKICSAPSRLPCPTRGIRNARRPLDDLSAALTDGKAFRARHNDMRMAANGVNCPASGNNTFFSPKRPGCGIVTPSHLETFPIRSKFLRPLSC